MKKKVTYFQMPKNIFFSSLSMTAKMLYCLLYDMSRAEKSTKKEDSRAYVIIKQKKLAELLQVSLRQITKTIKELEEHYFIRTERYGNETNRYYILPPEMLPSSEKYEKEDKL